jgi:hypothetical protein
MAAKYDRWHRIRLSGDQDKAKSFIPEARQLLGYLEEQRRLGIIKSELITRTLQDGSVIRAQFVGDQPLVEIHSPSAGTEPKPPAILEGFIVRPSEATGQNANTDKDHVLLRPRSKRAWRGYFYDTDAVPTDYPLRYGVYGTFGTTPLFPDGLGYAGNIDWRSADEQRMVTFHGPESRYFKNTTLSSPINKFVYFKGQQLLDLADVEVALIGAGTNAKVRGACLREERNLTGDDAALNGPSLFVIVTHFGFSTRTEYLLRFQVRPTEAAHPLAVRASATGRVAWWEAAMLEIVPESGRVLTSWAYPYSLRDDEHPWHFNQSGTEARCIRRSTSSGGDTYEVRVTVDPPAYSVVETIPCPELTSTTQDDWTQQGQPVLSTYAGDNGIYAVVNYDCFDPGYTHGDTGGRIVVPAPNDGYTALDGGSSSTSDSVVMRTRTVDNMPDSAWLKAAVDFRDDVPVYGYWRMPERHSTLQMSRDIDLTVHTDRNTTGISYLELYPAFWTLQSTITTVITATGTGHIEIGYAREEITGGLKTDWMEEVATTTENASQVTDTGENSVATVVLSGYGADESPTDNDCDVGNGTINLLANPRTITNGASTWPLSTTTSASGSFSCADTASNDVHDRTYCVGYLDLRYRLALTCILDNHTTTGRSASKTQTIGSYSDWQNLGKSPVSGGTNLLDAHSSAIAFDRLAPVQLRSETTALFEVPDGYTLSSSTSSGSYTAKWHGDGVGTLTYQQMIRGQAYFPSLSLSDYGGGSLYTEAAKTPKLVAQAVDTGTTGSVTTSSIDLALRLVTTLGEKLSVPSLTADDPNAPDNYRFGAWQVYKKAYCFSMSLPKAGAATQYFSGLGNALTGEPSRLTLTELTGTTRPRFHPISILTPTRIPT